MKYLVGKKEIWEQMVTVEAGSIEEAIEKVADCEGEILDNQFEYVDTAETHTWNVYDENEVLIG